MQLFQLRVERNVAAKITAGFSRALVSRTHVNNDPAQIYKMLISTDKSKVKMKV